MRINSVCFTFCHSASLCSDEEKSSQEEEDSVEAEVDGGVLLHEAGAVTPEDEP